MRLGYARVKIIRMTDIKTPILERTDVLTYTQKTYDPVSVKAAVPDTHWPTVSDEHRI